MSWTRDEMAAIAASFTLALAPHGVIGVAILLVAGWLISRIGGALWVGILPILLALIISTVLWPPTGWMVRHRVPKTLAALLSIIGSLGLLTGVIALIAPSIVSQSVQLADQTAEAITEVRDWLRGPPLNIRDEQLDGLLDQLSSTLQDRGDQIASGVFSGVSAVGSFVVTLVLVLVLTFFFIKDGPRFLPFVRRNTGRTAGRRREDGSATLPRHPLLRSLARDVRELQLRLPEHADEHPPGDEP